MQRLMTFRSKLLASILSLVAVTTAATLFIAQSQNTASYQAVLDELFRSEVSSFRARQEQQLITTRAQAVKLAESVRLFAALEEGDPEIYKIAGDELRLAYFAFFRLTDAQGKIIPPPIDSKAGWIELGIDSAIAAQLPVPTRGGEEGGNDIQTGFVPVEFGDRVPKFFSIVSCPIRNFDKTVGSLIIGQPVEGNVKAGSKKNTGLVSGVLMNGQFSPNIGSNDIALFAGPDLQKEIQNSDKPSRAWEQEIYGHAFRADAHLLNPGSRFAPAWIVSLFPMDDLHRRQRDLLWRITAIGGAGLLAAAGVGSLFARRLSQPVRDLVTGTTEIKQGNFEVRLQKRTNDELGTLADAFNEMAVGLALKEKYRSVLQLVTDRSVAEELMSGAVQLGGETREVSVIFCDIRGFTGISQGMRPADVVAMLNEHMSALTHVVDQHHGVVDKFVGDSIMTLFGAPKSYGQDAISAVRCAWDMIRERERMNDGAEQPLSIGIGIATGPALAGCMGSEKRLNYTVIGERVNLAARLCSQAGPMEIVIDETTRAALPPEFEIEKLDALTLKGFAEPVTAYRIKTVPS